jgi:hypothetical protein
MSSTSPSPKASAERQSAAKLGPMCPRCGGPLRRIPRRFIDVICHPLRPVARFHCKTVSCDWLGNLRRSAVDLDDLKRDGPKIL